MIAVPFDSEVHEIHEFDFVRSVRREMNDSLIFGFRHRRTGNWVLAAWVDRPHGKLLELAILGETPEGNHGAMESIRSMKRGNPEAEANKRHNREVLRHMETDWEKEEEEYNEAQKEADEQIASYYSKERRPSISVGSFGTKRRALCKGGMASC